MLPVVCVCVRARARVQCYVSRFDFPLFRPISSAARSKAWVCGRSLAGVAGSNPSGVMVSVSCKCCLFPGRADHLTSRFTVRARR